MLPIFFTSLDAQREMIFRRWNRATVAFLAIRARGIIGEIEVDDVAIVRALFEIEVTAAAVTLAPTRGVREWNEE